MNIYTIVTMEGGITNTVKTFSEFNHARSFLIDILEKNGICNDGDIGDGDYYNSDDNGYEVYYNSYDNGYEVYMWKTVLDK